MTSKKIMQQCERFFKDYSAFETQQVKMPQKYESLTEQHGSVLKS